MFISKDDAEIKWYWHDGKMHKVKITCDDNDLNLKELYEKAEKIVEEKDELCKSIFFLGLGITGSSTGGWGFLMGWLSRSIKQEKNWQIQHNEETIPEDEVIEYLASTMEEGARMLREKKGGDTPVIASTPSFGGTDGTELFK